jgi:hypothetical protein
MSLANPLNRKGRFANGLATCLAWVAQAYARERCIARDRKLLRSFDEVMLRDIDLTRADIEGPVRHPGSLLGRACRLQPVRLVVRSRGPVSYGRPRGRQ